VIVVDTNVIAALLLPTSTHGAAAKRLLQHDREWVAPLLWRSEFTNILATGTRNGWFDLHQAAEALQIAEDLMDGGDFHVPAAEVLQVAASSGCTGYDAEFVVLARDLECNMVTLDREILRKFSGLAVSLEETGTGGG